MLVIEGSRRMKTPRILNQLEAYWEALRPEGGLPSRDDVNPRGIEDALDYSFLLARSHSGEAVFRVAGERLGELFGVPLERVPMSVLFSRECQPQLAKGLKSVFEAPGILRAELLSASNLMRPELTAHLLIMPLQPQIGEQSLALGALHIDGIVGKPPRQFTQISLNLTRIVLDQSPLTTSSVQSEFGMAESGSSFEHKEKRPVVAGRPKFKIIDGGLD